MATPTRTTEHRPADQGQPPLEIVRSRRRRRTATAFVRGDRVVVQLPAGMSTGEEERMIRSLVDRVTGAARAQAAGGDEELTSRAHELADQYVDGVRPSSVQWSSRMQRRYGSCTPSDGSIRISDELARYPRYVLDYVLVHELAHLVVSGHSRRFHEIVDRFPQAQQARGFLEGVRYGRLEQSPQVVPSSGSSSEPFVGSSPSSSVASS